MTTNLKTMTSAVLAVAVALLLLPAAASANRAASTTISGAGSTLVAPLLSVWTQPVDHAFGYQLQYAAVGSGGGISAITSRSADFGASDAPMTSDQLAACKGCVQVPWALSATTLSYNLKGVPNDLHLDAPTIAGIFLGSITKWNDPAIHRQNPKVDLPDESITPVYRADPSGDTYAFTDYLEHTSKAWAKKIGMGTSVSWPTGTGEKGNSGVAGAITNTPGAIGYISAAYTLTNHLPVAAVKNAAGLYATPGLRGIAAAAAAVKKVPADGHLSIVDPPRSERQAYPISTFTYVILPMQTPKASELR